MSRDILVIGTAPPCPRCALLGEMVTSIVEATGIDATVRHIAYSSEEAGRIAASLGLVPGTAKQVAPKAGIAVDWDAVYQLIESPPATTLAVPTENPAAQKWSPALDQALHACRQAAREVGILMSPVLVIDGEVCHAGDIPAFEQIRAWLARG